MPEARDHPRPDARVGVFDSGVGGLSVLRELRAAMPGAPLHYVADTAYAPYGARSAADIQARSEAISAHLIAHGARLIVVACNTATAHAIDTLRARWPELAFVGTEPGVKPAVTASRNGRIGVLATPATVASARYAALLERHAQGVQVFSQGCPGVVEYIEAGDLTNPALRALVHQHCQPLRAAGVDTVLLGCTHYPFIEPLWREALGEDVTVLRIETAVAKRAASLWSGGERSGALTLQTSGDPAQLASWLHRVLDWQLPVQAWQPQTENASDG